MSKNAKKPSKKLIAAIEKILKDQPAFPHTYAMDVNNFYAIVFVRPDKSYTIVQPSGLVYHPALKRVCKAAGVVYFFVPSMMLRPAPASQVFHRFYGYTPSEATRGWGPGMPGVLDSYIGVDW